MAILETEMVEMEQIFLPYVLNNKGKTLYQEFKSGLEEAYMEGIIEYELALANYHFRLDAVNSEVYAELECLYEKHDPVKVIDLFDVYVHEIIV